MLAQLLSAAAECSPGVHVPAPAAAPAHAQQQLSRLASQGLPLLLELLR
jgi:hypothetical protein